MSAVAPTRRGLVAAMVAAPLIAAAPATGISARSTIEEHFARWKAAMLTINADETDSENEAEWEAVDAAEMAILASAETGARAAEIKLWIALNHSVHDRRSNHALAREDFGAIAGAEKGYDFQYRLVVAAMRSLRT